MGTFAQILLGSVLLALAYVFITLVISLRGIYLRRDRDYAAMRDEFETQKRRVETRQSRSRSDE